MVILIINSLLNSFSKIKSVFIYFILLGFVDVNGYPAVWAEHSQQKETDFMNEVQIHKGNLLSYES
jgi:hypothetical protein